MRILHTSDLHFGISIAGYPMIHEQKKLAGRLVALAREARADVVLIAGDIYDNAVSTAEAISVYDEMVTQLCRDVGVKVLVCAGNHDGAARLAAMGRLLERAGLYVAGSVRNGVVQVREQDCDFYLLPFFSIEEARFLYPDREIASYRDAFDALLEDIRSRFEPGRKQVLASHCYVSGAQVSESDRAVVVGGAAMVGADVFAGFDYVALGHLHRAQQIGNARYSGSPMKLSFGEADTPKSVTMLDTETMAVLELPVSTERDLRVAEGTFDELLAQAEADANREDYIKIILRDRYAHIELQDIFRRYYPNLLMMEGKQYDAGDAAGISAGEAVSLSAQEIMERFVTEATGEQPTGRQKDWFAQAVRQGGDAL